jgi:hypothetical protein
MGENMAIRNLDRWMDKHTWVISKDSPTTTYYDTEEVKRGSDYEKGICGYLNQQDVLEASGDAMYSINLKNYVEENLQDYLKEAENEAVKHDLILPLFNRIVENVKDGDFNLDNLDDAELDLLAKAGITENTLNEFEDKFIDEGHTPDDYCPIWLKAWEFPTGYTPEQLNEFDISGIVFFDINSTTYIGLTTCGMDMTPSLEYAYFMYSNLDIAKIYYKKRLFKQPSYFEYVVGKEAMLELCKKLGITQKKLDYAEKEVKKRSEEFRKSLDQLSELRDSGKIDQNLTSLFALSQYFKHEQKEKEQIKAMTNA